FDQAARYNMVLKLKYLIVTNGLEHYCCEIDFIENRYSFLEIIPNYNNIL
ncbi:MAG: type I restriction enzyme HsdR N-terminal domain-containing protein, partial [Bacteroidales bacterium]